MIETIAATHWVGAGTTPSRVYGWDVSRTATGDQVLTCRHPGRPDGVSTVQLINMAGLDHPLLKIEGNITSCLYGKQGKAGSLHKVEVQEGADLLLSQAVGWAELRGVDDPSGWSLTRLDPSMTYRVREGHAESVIRQAADRLEESCTSSRSVWSMHRSHGGTTATARLSKGCVRKIYNKGVETRSQGLPMPVDALRCEATIRPKKLARWQSLDARLSMTEEVLTMAEQELSAIEQLIWGTTASTGVAMVDLLRKGGASATEAYRLWGVLSIADERGWDSLGVPYRTAHDWRKRIEKYLDAAGGDEAVKEAMRGMTESVGGPLYAAELVEMLTEADDDE